MRLINGEEITDSFEIWSVKRPDSDGDGLCEIAFEDKETAILDHGFFGGVLWVRTAYTTEGHEVTTEEAENETTGS